MKKNLEILQKLVRFYFFFDQTPFSLREVSDSLFKCYQPHSQGLLPFQKKRTDGEKNDKFLNTSKNHSAVQKCSKYSVVLY